MIDNFMHHFTGQCGEAHPNIFTLIILLAVVYAIQKARNLRYKNKEKLLSKSNVC
jgi:hypothetical protein